MRILHYASFLDYPILSNDFAHNLYANDSHIYIFGVDFCRNTRLVDRKVNFPFDISTWKANGLENWTWQHKTLNFSPYHHVPC